MYAGAWGGRNVSPNNHIKMSSRKFVAILTRALGGADYSTIHDALQPLAKVPDTSNFIGREGDIAECAKALDKYKFLIIEGLAGVGKTSLAARLAKTVRNRFEDRVAWISLNQNMEEKEGHKPAVTFDEILKQVAAFFVTHGDDSLERLRTTQGATLQDKYNQTI